jgi:Uma2 family endonuclease
MALDADLTIEDFERLPDALANNHELVDGELIDVSGNTVEHNGLRDSLVAMLLPHVRDHKLGRIIAEQEYAFGDDAHGPDITLIGPEKLPLLNRKRRVQPFVPDLAIEVVSTNDRFTALVRKAKKYRRYGTREVWIFNIEEREAYLYSSDRDAILNENETFSSPQIPGFSIRLGELFDRTEE